MNRVSVIIPVFNSEKTIYNVLKSVVNQTAISEILEIIIINDGSTDKSDEIIKQFMEENSNINFFYIEQENRGVSSARNRGMKIAKGEFIAFIDSDDLWMSQKIERQLAVIDENPEIVFLGTSSFFGTDMINKVLSIRGKKIESLYNATIHDVYWKHFPVTPSVLFRRNAINKIGYFDENQIGSEDINYFQRFCIHFNYYYLPEPLVHISYNKSYFGSMGLSSNFKAMHNGELKNLNELKEVGVFNLFEYCMYRLFIQVKYWRRRVIRFCKNN